jgi:REase_DpnII-MboI
LPGTVERRWQIERLIAENEALEERLSKWQRDPAPSPTETRDGQRAYHDWYARAKHYVQDGERDTFCDMYEGGQFIRRISTFLAAPLEEGPFYDPSNKDSIIPKWAHSFGDTCRPALMKQRQILAQALHETTGVDSVLDELAAIFRRLPEFISALGVAANPNVPAPTVANERDLQVLTNGILRLLYRNVIPEDAVPKKSGASSRADFVIKDEGVLVETKMTRKSLTDKRVGDELLIDWGRYPRYPDIRGVFALVYDPKRYLRNPAALEDDLLQSGSDVSMRAIVVW